MRARPPEIDPDELQARLAALPGVGLVRDAVGEVPAYLVGGAVRDLLLEGRRADVDVVVVGDAVAVARRLGGELVVHERFGTATVIVDGRPVDLAGARTEHYAHPGALPEVRPGDIAADLARRDFTVNAMALPLHGPPELIDPHGGAADLAAAELRVLHEGSLADDPTRALRAARYAARLGFGVEARTARLLAQADLKTVSRERVEAEVGKLALEAEPAAGFGLAAEWGLLDLDAEALGLIRLLPGLLDEAPWSEVASAPEAILAVAGDRLERPRELLARHPSSPSEAVEAAHGRSGVELALARGLGAVWLDRYVAEWRDVRLEIGGTDLLEAGVPEGPAVGGALAAALRAKLDGEASGAAGELRVALRAAGGRAGR